MSGQLYQDGVFVSTGNPATVNESTPFSLGQLGKKITIDGKTYQYVLRGAGAINDAGLGMSWEDAAAYKVYIATASTPYAGVFLGDDNATDVTTRGMQVGNYGFIQVGGPATCVAGAAVTAGAAVHMVAASGKFITQTAGIKQVGQAATTAAGDGSTFTVLLDD